MKYIILFGVTLILVARLLNWISDTTFGYTMLGVTVGLLSIFVVIILYESKQQNFTFNKPNPTSVNLNNDRD